MTRPRKPLAEAVGTPDSCKVALSGVPFVAGTHRKGQRVRIRQRASKVTVDEPVMELLDKVMLEEGVSGKRLEMALGLAVDKLRDMRRSATLWATLKIARRCLWAMGYDLEVRVRKLQNPDRDLVMTHGDYDYKLMEKLVGKGVGKWNRRGMWTGLGIDKLK